MWVHKVTDITCMTKCCSQSLLWDQSVASRIILEVIFRLNACWLPAQKPGKITDFSTCHNNNNRQAFYGWEVLMSRPACDPLWVSHPSRRELTVGDMKRLWHVLVFAVLLYCCESCRRLPLTDACRPGTAGRWGCPPTRLSGSFSPRIGPWCPVEGQRYCDSTGYLWSPAACAHKQRWPAGAHSMLEFFD